MTHTQVHLKWVTSRTPKMEIGKVLHMLCPCLNQTKMDCTPIYCCVTVRWVNTQHVFVLRMFLLTDCCTALSFHMTHTHTKYVHTQAFIWMNGNGSQLMMPYTIPASIQPPSDPTMYTAWFMVRCFLRVCVRLLDLYVCAILDPYVITLDVIIITLLFSIYTCVLYPSFELCQMEEL